MKMKRNKILIAFTLMNIVSQLQTNNGYKGIKNHIMAKANINAEQWKEMMPNLLKKGYVFQAKNIYYVTEWGLKLIDNLSAYETLHKKLIKDLELGK